eukprot:CAMPEP_0171559740 /NCGR_PEP_ID=MMETSP0960-20121227/13063_1 /TAXON_ID=87120 /ORGANISM="Aurantiochytrium limacinum, Strain ATCCMYA-1381" /LENGTH=52 /DNA_ID=CAMNT_0012111371 /DNA_START=247 /DNA_END=405 /DNA_ORIENTATION=+
MRQRKGLMVFCIEIIGGKRDVIDGEIRLLGFLSFILSFILLLILSFFCEEVE